MEKSSYPGLLNSLENGSEGNSRTLGEHKKQNNNPNPMPNNLQAPPSSDRNLFQVFNKDPPTVKVPSQNEHNGVKPKEEEELGSTERLLNLNNISMMDESPLKLNLDALSLGNKQFVESINLQSHQMEETIVVNKLSPEQILNNIKLSDSYDSAELGIKENNFNVLTVNTMKVKVENTK